MRNQTKLECLVDIYANQYSFIGMKPPAAGRLELNKAFEYIGNHKIGAVAS